jgi:hypothetical protein
VLVVIAGHALSLVFATARAAQQFLRPDFARQRQSLYFALQRQLARDIRKMSVQKSPQRRFLVAIQLDLVRFFHVAVVLLMGACATSSLGAGAPSAAQTDETAVLEGTMEVLIEDLNQEGRLLYFLVSKDRRVPLRFAAPPPNLTTGTRARVRGRWAKDGALVVETFERL